MCFKKLKFTLDRVTGKKHQPTEAYITGQMPTYTVPDLIAHIEYRIMIHESWIGLLDDNPSYAGSYGDEAFHWWAIEGYENMIYYLKGNKNVLQR